MVASASLAPLSNPLVTSSQLRLFLTTPTAASRSTQFANSILTQAAGILLRLPQPVIATAIVILQRYQVGYAPLATQEPSPSPCPQHLSAAAIYLAAKNSATHLSPRSIINVYAYLTSSESSPLPFVNPSPDANPDPKSYYVSEGTYASSRLRLFQHESLILSALGFDLHLNLPHPLALTYLSALTPSNTNLATRVFEHLNGALLSPQLLYLTHQPNVLAVAAIYLAAREVGVTLVQGSNWWEVFDVEREALGFCVMAMGSLGGFAEREGERWRDGERIGLK